MKKQAYFTVITSEMIDDVGLDSTEVLFGRDGRRGEEDYLDLVRSSQDLIERYERNGISGLSKEDLDSVAYDLYFNTQVTVIKKPDGRYSLGSNGKHRLYIAKKNCLKLIVQVVEEINADVFLTEEIKKQLRYQIFMNNFETNEKETELYVNLDGNCFSLNDADTIELMKSDIKTRIKIKNGMTADEYFAAFDSYDGYKVFRTAEKKYIKDSIIECENSHGLYFVAAKSELLRIIMTSPKEDFGTALAYISFKDRNGSVLQDVHISQGENGYSYRTLRFYLKKIESLDNYDLIVDLYNSALDCYKVLLYDDSQYAFLTSAIDYYTHNGCLELVRALKDLHIDCRNTF